MGFVIQAWHWLAVGVALAALEILVPGNVVIWIGIAAIAVGAIMLVAPQIDPTLQLGLFAGFAVLSLGLGFYLRRRKPEHEAQVNIGSHRLHGQTVVLVSPIVAGQGEAKVGDTVWPVTGPDLPAGTKVVITGGDGVVLTVTPASPA